MSVHTAGSWKYVEENLVQAQIERCGDGAADAFIVSSSRPSYQLTPPKKRDMARFESTLPRALMSLHHAIPPLQIPPHAQEPSPDPHLVPPNLNLPPTPQVLPPTASPLPHPPNPIPRRSMRIHPSWATHTHTPPHAPRDQPSHTPSHTSSETTPSTACTPPHRNRRPSRPADTVCRWPRCGIARRGRFRGRARGGRRPGRGKGGWSSPFWLFVFGPFASLARSGACTCPARHPGVFSINVRRSISSYFSCVSASRPHSS